MERVYLLVIVHEYILCKIWYFMKIDKCCTCTVYDMLIHDKYSLLVTHSSYIFN